MDKNPEVLLNARRFRVVRQMETTSDGKEHVRETIEHPGSVAILPLLDDGRVCLIRNRRIAVHETLIELPAGTLDRDEDPAEAARRELIEETGYRAESIQPLHQFYLSPGILSERMHLYLASGLTQGNPQLEPGEQIETLLVTWADALEMVRDGRIRDVKTLVGLLYYDRFGTR
ncbi:MAG: NUDIX hydrolase [Pirellulales bacterium]